MKTKPHFNVPATADPAKAVHHPGWHRRARAAKGRSLLLAAAVLAGGTGLALAQDNAPSSTYSPPVVLVTNTAAVAHPPTASGAPNAIASATNEMATATAAEGASTNGLRLNFRNAPIDLVLKYLSEAAGFIIEMDTPVHGTVSVISSHPMTKDEAVNLLNSVLNQNGYAAIRSGKRTLKIMEKSAAITGNNPVRVGNDPNAIPDNDEMVTQIIPIRYVDAQQLVSDLSPFVSSSARIVANQAGNSIVITDTQANIRHLAEIIKAIDSSAEDVTELRVFHLKYADPTEVASLLTSLFPDQSNGGMQAPIRFGRGGFFRRMAARMAANNGGNSQSDRVKKRMQVVAVADPRTSSVVVTATKDLMAQIADMIQDLDFKSSKDQTVKVFHLKNADAQEILPVLQNMFQSSTTVNRNTSGNQTSPFQARLQQFQNSASSTSGTMGSGLGGTRPGGNRGGSGLP